MIFLIRIQGHETPGTDDRIGPADGSQFSSVDSLSVSDPYFAEYFLLLASDPITPAAEQNTTVATTHSAKSAFAKMLLQLTPKGKSEKLTRKHAE